jgi:hypothetical protein
VARHAGALLGREGRQVGDAKVLHGVDHRPAGRDS